MPKRYHGVFIQFPTELLFDDLGAVSYFLVDGEGNHHRMQTIPVRKETDFDAISLALRRRILTDLRKAIS